MFNFTFDTQYILTNTIISKGTLSPKQKINSFTINIHNFKNYFVMSITVESRKQINVVYLVQTLHLRKFGCKYSLRIFLIIFSLVQYLDI